MAYTRIVRQNYFNAPQLAAYKVRERYMLIGLACIADDYGRFWLNYANIRSGVFPTDDISLDWIEEAIRKFISSQILCVYEADGVEYAHFPLWREKGWFLKQRLDHPREFTSPSCPICENEKKTRKKRETSRAIKFNSIQSNIKKENRIKDNPTGQEIRELLYDPTLREELCSKYSLITSQIYGDALNRLISEVEEHPELAKNYEREFEKMLLNEQARLEKEGKELVKQR